MGKKSKKKASTRGNGGGSRKERLQERREQQLNLRDPDGDHRHDGSRREREYFVGDRVWFQETSSWGDGLNPNTYRGIVSGARGDLLDVIPLQSKIDGRDDSVRVPAKDVFPDFCNLTLRFDIGDRVLCNSGRAIDRGWQPKTVTCLWPIAEIEIQGQPAPRGPNDVVPRYKGGDLCAPCDNDYCIMRHPTSFRFGIGDRVVFDQKAAQGAPHPANVSSWLEGTVVGIDITGMAFYAAYSITFEREGKQYSCFITKDDDEHIAGYGSDPRKRLFDAIEQDCTVLHLMYIVETFNIDVASFRDLALAKAMEFASYRALAWLGHCCNIDALHFEDDRGNNLFHKIASSPNAAGFFEVWGEVSSMRPMPSWRLGIRDRAHNRRLTNLPNADGETWLQILVRRGDVRALDAALSPHNGLAWMIFRDEFDQLSVSINNSGHAIMQCIFDSFIKFRDLLKQYMALDFIGTVSSEEELLQHETFAVFCGEGASHHAKVLCRFYRDWRHHRCGELELCSSVTSLVGHGFFRLFSLLCDAGDWLFLNETYRSWSKEDRKEYIQPELSPDTNDFSSYDCLEVDIFDACIIGNEGPRYHRKVDTWSKDYYFQCLKRHTMSCDHNTCPSWLSHLKGMSNSFDDLDAKDFWKRKVQSLQDDDSLEGRLKILDYLMQRQPNAATRINAVEAIRHRQCGVLRFMMERGLIQVDTAASSNKMLTKYSAKLQFLEKSRIPSSMQVKDFLCFCAVEYDDLQSLQWLCESSGVPAFSCDGWNLLHFSAFLGRLEIISWLYTQPQWQSLAAEACQRTPHQNSFSVHIAASQGHLVATDLMLAMNVEVADMKGRQPEYYAKKLNLDFVQKWVAEREKPSALERDVKKLLRLINTNDTTAEQLKGFIESSKCLEAESWFECNYHNFEVKGPMGCSFRDVLQECCSKFPDEEFVLWLCKRIYFLSKRVVYGIDDFWGGNLMGASQEFGVLKGNHLLPSFAASGGQRDIAEYLQTKWCKDISIKLDGRSALLVGTLRDQVLQCRVLSQLIRAVTCLNIVSHLGSEFRKLIMRGGTANELHELLRIDALAKEILIDEGYAESDFKHCLLDVISLVRPFDMTRIYLDVSYGDKHPLLKQLAFAERYPVGLSQMHIVLAVEGFHELVHYCLKNLNGWTAEMELDVVRIAAFYGHSRVLDLFLGPGHTDHSLLSDLESRHREATLGWGEACRYRDLCVFVETQGVPYDRIKEGRFDTSGGNFQQIQDVTKQSLICALLNGCAHKCLGNRGNELGTEGMKLLQGKLGYTHSEIILALELLLHIGYSVEWTETVVFLLGKLKFQPIMSHDEIQALCRCVVKRCSVMNSYEAKEGVEAMESEKKILQWIEGMANVGIDIQNMAERRTPFTDQYTKLEQQQLSNWSQFDVVKKGGSLCKIKEMINEGAMSINSRDRGGLMLTHICSAYDRVDVLAWLIGTKKMDMNAKDCQGRTALDVAEASKAASTKKWILEWKASKTIATFMKQNYRQIVVLRWQQRLYNAAVSIQRHYRGDSIRKLYLGAISNRIEASRRFVTVWGALVQSNQDFLMHSSNWSSMREIVLDISKAEFGEHLEDTDNQLSKALEGAMQVADDEEAGSCISNLTRESECQFPTEEVEANHIRGDASWLNFQMTR